jgi:hypothetical protein
MNNPLSTGLLRVVVFVTLLVMLFICIIDCLDIVETKNCCCTATSLGMSDTASAGVKLTGRAASASIRQLCQRLYKIGVNQAPHLNLLYNASRI